jgi:plastocyanin
MKVRMLRAGGTLVALSALTIVATGAGASADSAAKRAAATITMEKNGRELFFEGPRTVAEDAKLKVENLTNPNRVGPHTFSLIKKRALPEGNREFRKCGDFELKVCANIVEAHQVDLKTFEVGKPIVGGKTWNKSFSNRAKGDSWYTEKKGNKDTRRVTAAAGSKLFYFCLIHPEMQGKIKVTE